MNTATLEVPVVRVQHVEISADALAVNLEDGRTIAVPIGWFPRLAYGTAAERANVRIVGAGFGLHWPDLDEDIGVEGLLFGKKSMESPASFARWLAQRAATPQDKPPASSS